MTGLPTQATPELAPEQSLPSASHDGPVVVDVRDGVVEAARSSGAALSLKEPVVRSSSGLGWPADPPRSRVPAVVRDVDADDADDEAVDADDADDDEAVAKDGESASAGAAPAPAALTPELFVELVKTLPPGYALIPVGYELRTAPPVKTAARSGAATKGQAKKSVAASTAGSRWTLPDRPVLVGSAITVIAMMLLVFASNALLFGHLKHVRDQRVALDDLRASLANGTAPVNQTDDDNKPIPNGTPLGILEIPALGLREVYLEGTTSEVLMSGVAHRRDTVMPGQLGTSVIYGRRTAFGGPFSLLDQLPLDSVILVTNGMGEKLPFKVVGARRGGDPLPAAPASGARLTLVTATGGPYQPDGSLRIDADFVPGQGVNGQQLQVTSGKPLQAGLTAAERPLAGDSGAWPGIVAGLLLLFPLTVWFAFARARWGRWQAWLSGMPPLLATGIFLTNAVIRLLPNLM